VAMLRNGSWLTAWARSSPSKTMARVEVVPISKDKMCFISRPFTPSGGIKKRPAEELAGPKQTCQCVATRYRERALTGGRRRTVKGAGTTRP